MITKANTTTRIGPMPYPSSSSFLRRDELVATFRVTFLSNRSVAFRKRAELFPLGMMLIEKAGGGWRKWGLIFTENGIGRGKS